MKIREVRAGLLVALGLVCAVTARAGNTATVKDGVLTITLDSAAKMTDVVTDDQIAAMRMGTVTAVVKNGNFIFTNDVASLEGYTGPWTINAGTFVCTNPDGLGSGVVTQKASVVRFATSGTWNNSVVFTSTSAHTFYFGGGRMNGDISSANAALYLNAGAMNFYGAIYAPGRSVYSQNTGAFNFYGPVTASQLNMSDWYKIVYSRLYSPDNAIGSVGACYALTSFETKNCATNALLKLGYTENNGDTNLRGAFHFNADQTFRGFVDCTDSRHTNSTSYHTSWINNGARITFTGDADTATDMRFCGNGGGAVAWCPPGRRTLTFHNKRNHPFNGGLVVSNGVFTCTETTAFPNARFITAGQGGFFNFDSTGSLANMRTITAMSCATVNVAKASSTFVSDYITFSLSSDSVVDLGDRTDVLLAHDFTVDGEHLDGGYYTGSDSTAAGATKIPQLRGSTVVQVPEYEVPTEACTWDAGAGAGDTSVQTAANWAGDALPDFTSMGAWPTFATAGDRATVDRAVAFKGMTFSGRPRFTVDATGAGAISLYQRGLLFVGDDTTLRTNAISAPIVQQTGHDWMVEGSKTYAEIRGPVSASGSYTITKGGAGTLDIHSTNTFSGAFTITNGTVNVYSGKNPFGAGDGVLRFKGSGTPAARLLFKRGVEIDKTCILEINGVENPSSRFRLTDAAHATNVFHRPVTFLGSTLYVFMGNSGRTTFEDTVTADTYLAMQGNGVDVHFKGFLSFSDWSAQGGIRSYVYRPHNNTPCWNIRMGCTVTCMTNDIFSLCKNLSAVGSGSTWYLNGFDQHVPTLYVSSGGRVVNNGAPARLTVTEGSTSYATAASGSFASGTQMTGPIDFTHGIAGKTFTVDTEIAATGQVEVTAGTLVFSPGSSWLGATNVTVSGGTLRIVANSVFPKTVPVTLGASGTIDLQTGVEQLVSSLTIPGVTPQAGTWGAEGATDAAGRPVDFTSDRLAGGGCLRVGVGGFIIFFK